MCVPGSKLQTLYGIPKLESIQRKSVKTLGYRTHHTHIDYELSLKTYDIISLQHRRSLIDLIHLYKIKRHFVDTPFLLEFFFRVGLNREKTNNRKTSSCHAI